MNNFKLFCFIIISLLFITNCKNKATDNNGKKVFRYNESAGITSLDPAFAKDQANIWAVNQIYNGLVQLNERLEVMPCIAKSWTISDNGKCYTFLLRNDVYFHPHELFKNKRRVIAKDFEYSFNRITDIKIASPGAWIFNNVLIKNGKPSFIALNDSVFEIRLQQAFPPFIGLLSMQYCSVIAHEIAENFGNDFRRNPIGTGPFMFKLWKEGVKLVLVKNPDYFEFENGIRLPYIDAVAVSFIVDKQSVFMEFMKGNIDFMSGIDPNYKDVLVTRHGKLNPKYNNSITLFRQPYLNTEYFGFLCDTSLAAVKNSPTLNVKVRQAINYAFDRKKMIKFLRNNSGTAGIYGITPPGLPSFDTTIVKGYTYNPTKAKELLAQAGYPNGKGLAPIKLYTTASYLDICKYFQQQIDEVGITINIEVSPAASLREQIAQGKIAFFRGSWIADYPDAENYLSLFYSKNFCPEGPNYTHFSDKEYDKLYLQALSQTNDSIRYDLYRKMENIIIKKSPVIVLYYDEVLRFCRKNIIGLEANPLNLLILKKVKKG